MEGAVVSGRYEIRELAGTGGMGSVYRALDRQAGIDVAVKVVSTTEASNLARFDREARVLMGLSHRHVVGYKDRGVTDQGRPFLVLDWLEGETLAQRLAHAVPTVEQAVALVGKIARALGHAHAQNVVHRDVKPSNVFLVGAGWDEPRVLDFGVARLLSGTKLMTRSGTALGTPAYMAPEQARGQRDVDARADVYALGCLLFESLTGHAPFEGDDVMAVLAKVLFEEPPRLVASASAFPASLDELVLRLMQKEPGQRPANGDEVADLLVAIAEDVKRHDDGLLLHSSRPPRPLTTREQRLVAVVAATPAESPGGARGANAPTLAAEAVMTAHDFANEAASFGARFAPLADGSCIAVLEGVGSATDLALRAARCALALRSRRPELPLAIAMGRATSERVPVGEVIDRVAALLRGAGEASGIRVDDLVSGLLDRRFAIAEDDRGSSLQYELDAPLASRLLLGRPSPCVGRARELRMLGAFFEECVAEPAASLALVTGAPGMGKTRLVSEWLGRLATGDTPPLVWIGRGDPIAAGSPLALLGAALRGALGLRSTDVGERAHAIIRARVARSAGGDDARRIAEFLGEIVGAPFPREASVELRAARGDATLMGDQMRRAFEDFVVAEARTAPVVLVLEDTHWGDAASIRIVEGALRFARHSPFCAVVVGRPDVTTAFPTLTSLRGVLHLVVGELSRKHCEMFVDELLEGGLDTETKARILDHAGGNAFFLEELVRYVAERRAAGRPGDAVMPPTVVAMLQTRLEALPATTRRFLRAASVFGNAFWLDGVAALLGETGSTGGPTRDGAEVDAPAAAGPDQRAVIERLLREELVETRPSSRFAGQVEITFRHALVRDAAYQMLTDRDRIAGHRLAGEWLERAGELDRRALGEHFERGAAPARAARWFTDAAAQALEGHDFRGALELTTRARAGDTGNDLAGRIALLESEAHRWSGDLLAAEAASRAALDTLPSGTAGWFAAAEQLAAIAGVHSDYRPAVLWRERIAGVSHGPGATGARILALCAVGRRLFQAGDYAADEVVDFVRAERDAAGDRLEPRVVAEIERLVGARARHRGDVGGDLAGYRAAHLAYEQAGDVRGACNALVSVGFSYIQLGDHEAARDHLARALEQAARLGLATVQTRANQNLALVHLATGDLEQARSLAEAVAEEAGARGDERFEGWTRVYLARIHRARGDAAEATRQAAASMTKLSASPPAYAGALAARALAELDLGNAVEGDLAAREALAILEEYDGIEEFESLVLAAAVRATAAIEGASAAATLARRCLERLEVRAAAISDPELARSFLHGVPENVELREICAGVLRSQGPSSADRLRLPLPERVGAAWSAAAFEQDAALVVPRLIRHLARATAGEGTVTRGFPGPAAILDATPGGFSEEPSMELSALLEDVLARSPTQHHPRYVGHQVSAALPRAALLGLVAQVLNNGMAAFESGPAMVALERRVIDWMLGVAGFPPAGGGVLTSGGSLGNLTALLAARQAKAGVDVRERGLAAAPPLAVLVSEQAHYSIERAAQVMGLGRDAVVPVTTDAAYRLDPSDVRAAHRRATERGLRPFALVASAGATGTGSIDPLNAAADLAEELGLWLHVDGAHGASALLSARYRTALAGIERADSLVWDAHKLMSMPALATAVLFRDGATAYATFAQKAAYLFEDRQEPPWFDIGLRTIECTKPLIALSLYGCLATLGTRVFAEAVELVYDLARAFARLLVAEPDFEIACQPDANIVCFRYVPDPSRADLDDLQREIRDALRESGAFYCVVTTLRGKVYLRVSLMNPRTTFADLEALVAAIRGAGA